MKVMTAAVPRRRERTRSALLAAALDAVEEKGFIGASLDEIAARAGMTKGAIYSNFGSKADFMLALARSQAPRFAPAYQPGAPLAVQLRAVADSAATMLPAIRRTARLQAQFALFLREEPALRRQIEGELSSGFASLIALVERHHTAELAVPASTLVMTLQALSLGFAHQSMITPALVDEATLRAAFELVLVGALGSESRPCP